MSVVACKITDEKIEVSADSIRVRGGAQNKKYSKLVKHKDMIFGSVGHGGEMMLFLNYIKTKYPKHNTYDGILDYFNSFIIEVRNITGRKDYESENAYILIVNNKAWYFYDYYLIEIKEYEAIGAGENYALSALYLGYDTKKAVKTACELSIYCEEPIKTYIVNKKNENKTN